MTDPKQQSLLGVVAASSPGTSSPSAQKANSRKLGMVPEDPKRGGWAWARFHDSYGSEIVVKPSSAGKEDTVWVFAHADPTRLLPWMTEFSPHLTRAQAKKLIRGLQKFVDAAARGSRPSRERRRRLVGSRRSGRGG